MFHIQFVVMQCVQHMGMFDSFILLCNILEKLRKQNIYSAEKFYKKYSIIPRVDGERRCEGEYKSKKIGERRYVGE